MLLRGSQVPAGDGRAVPVGHRKPCHVTTAVLPGPGSLYGVVSQEADNLELPRTLVHLESGIAVSRPSIVFSGLIFFLGDREQKSSAFTANAIPHGDTILS